MAANPRGSMRPNGRSPPFLAIGLCVALVILGFNYWSLSARNGEQANEIALMESELRLVNAKKTSSEKRGEALSDKVADLEKEISSQKEIIASKMSELQSVKQTKEECAQKVNDMEGDRVTMNDKLDVCEAEKSSLRGEAEQLKGDAETLKNRQCEASDCETFSKQSREQTLRDINRVAGNGPLIDLYKMGGDVGQFADQLKELAALAQNNAAIQQAGNNLPNADNQQQQQQQQGVDMNPQQPNAVITNQVGAPGGVLGGGDQGAVQGGLQSEVKNDQSQTQTEVENKDSAQQQQQTDNNNDDADEGIDSAQVARPDVNELSETGHNGLSKSYPTTANKSYTTTQTLEQGNQTTRESTTTVANHHAFTNSTNGDGTEAQMFPPVHGDGVDPDEDEDDYDDEDDEIDQALKLGADDDDKDMMEDEDEDYDYDEDDEDVDDDTDYRYNDNQDEDERDVQNNDNTIEEMYQRDRQGQP